MNSNTRSALTALATAAILLAQLPSATCAESGFEPIFNGKDLAGWEGNTKLWSVKEGAITGRTTAEEPLKGNTFLIWSKGSVSDFELRCSYKIVANNDKGFANSGIQYRSKVLDPAGWVVGGYQADLEAGDTYTGILYEERMTRGIMAARGEKVTWDKDCKKQVTGSLGKSDEIQSAIKKADWNDYVIIAHGNHIQHFVNGKQTVDVTDECESKRANSGVLALQLHAGQPMTVQFRDLRIKSLSSSTASSDDFKKIEGTWQVVSAELNGETVPPEDVNNIVVKIKDGGYIAEFSDRTDRGKLKLDASKKPAEMDIFPESGNDAGKKLPAIYEVSGDNMKVCYSQEGSKRPSAFSTSGEYGLLLVTYKRKAE